MPKQLFYEILIYDKDHRDKNIKIQLEGTLREVVEKINNHYGINLVSIDICNNILNRRYNLAAKYSNIYIYRFLAPTKKYPCGNNGMYPSSETISLV